RTTRLRIRPKGPTLASVTGTFAGLTIPRVKIAANQPNKPLSNAKPEVCSGAFLPSCDLRHTHLSQAGLGSARLRSQGALPCPERFVQTDKGMMSHYHWE